MSSQLVILILNFVFLSNALSNREVVRWIQSPTITKWGRWGSPEICPINSWVGGMRLKIDTSRRWRSDDTALNGVQLQCVNMDWNHSGYVTSATGSYGNYRQPKYCPQGFATGYQLRSETNVNVIGAVDFRLKCTNFDGTTSYVINSEYSLPCKHLQKTDTCRGSWSPEQFCPNKTAICGISTHVEAKLGSGSLRNDTSFNNVNLACCTIPDPAENCNLETMWETVASCPQASKKCDLKLITGVFQYKKLSRLEVFYERLGFTVDLKLFQKILKINAKNSKLHLVNGKSLESIVEETKIPKNKLSVQTTCEGIWQQLVVICGFYKVFTKEYRCIPNGTRGKLIERGLFFQPISRMENIFWSYDCEFKAGNITTKRSQSEDCGDICLNEKLCTHFTWTGDQGGICWLKGSGVNLKPTEKYYENLICGWIERN